MNIFLKHEVYLFLRNTYPMVSLFRNSMFTCEARAARTEHTKSVSHRDISIIRINAYSTLLSGTYTA